MTDSFNFSNFRSKWSSIFIKRSLYRVAHNIFVSYREVTDQKNGINFA